MTTMTKVSWDDQPGAGTAADKQAPRGYRIEHVFQHLNEDVADEYPPSQSTEVVTVPSWDHICVAVDELLHFTGDGHTVSIRVEKI